MRYEFTVATRMSDTALAAFPELEPSTAPSIGTTLFGPVTDRAHIDGLLARFSHLGLDVVDMHRLPD
jgi:hypothetical protein